MSSRINKMLHGISILSGELEVAKLVNSNRLLKLY